MRRFDPMRNEDGSLSFFRIGCLTVAAVCMLSYASLMLGCASSHEESAQNAAAPEVDDSAIIDDEHQDDAVELRSQAIAELLSAESYFRDCGSLNKGFEGCAFKFSADLTGRYEVSETAADDGFAVSLSLKDAAADHECAVLRTDSSGLHEAFDAEGKENSGCWPASAGAAASGDNISGEAQGASETRG